MRVSLEQALECFNRKERNLLVRAVLGHQEKPLQLTEPFRKQVAKELHLASIPENAWWATDYHISWLAGALAVFVKGGAAVFRKEHDQPLPPWPNHAEGNPSRQLVEGNQEDVDLAIATGCELIMIEAKGYHHFGRDQLESKLQRLKLLHAFYSDTLLPRNYSPPVIRVGRG